MDQVCHLEPRTYVGPPDLISQKAIKAIPRVLLLEAHLIPTGLFTRERGREAVFVTSWRNSALSHHTKCVRGDRGTQGGR